jgi:hypothetical protein
MPPPDAVTSWIPLPTSSTTAAPSAPFGEESFASHVPAPPWDCVASAHAPSAKAAAMAITRLLIDGISARGMGRRKGEAPTLEKRIRVANLDGVRPIHLLRMESRGRPDEQGE